MKKQKQRIMKYGFGIVIFCGAFVVTTVAIKASVGDVTGWLWGGSEESNDATVNGNETGVGWISMNNLGAGGSTPYGVNIPFNDGPVTGYAWSGGSDANNPGIGWIQFNPSGPYPTTGCGSACPTTSVMRSGNNLVGWARIVGVAQEKLNNNSGGWDGWIKMDGGANYGVTVSGSNVNGYAWSNELGYIKFNVSGNGVVLPALPTAMLSAAPSVINVDADSNWASGVGTPVDLSWNITGVTTCTKSANNEGVWSGTTNGTGAEQVNQNKVAVTYTLTCTGITNPVNVTVSAGCYPNVCDASAKCSKSTSAITPALNSGACASSNVCSTDSDCQPRSTGVWREVAP